MCNITQLIERCVQRYQYELERLIKECGGTEENKSEFLICYNAYDLNVEIKRHDITVGHLCVKLITDHGKLEYEFTRLIYYNPGELEEAATRLKKVAEEYDYTPLPCPFCGEQPTVFPIDPKEEGNAWGRVQCVNKKCVANLYVDDGEDINDDRGSDEYKKSAIKRWNTRYAPTTD